MRNLAKWCGLSLSVHLVLTVAIVLSLARERRTAPVFVDLTLELNPYPDSAPLPRASIFTAVKGIVHRKTAANRPDQTARDATLLPQPTASRRWTTSRAEKPKFIPAFRHQEFVEDRTSTSTQSISAESGKETTEGKPHVFPGEGSPTPEKAGNRYLREHFAYIRESIMKHLIYPALARRMNWSGKVTLTFVVCEDGDVSDIRVVESSGYPLLDRSAMDTVRKAAPFPKPPIRAEIVLPVSYRLL